MPVLALPHLYDGVVTRFATELTDVSNFWGRREYAKHKRDARRIVWVPGDPTGALGTIVGARNPGRNPRSLATLEELFTCYIGAFDVTSAEDERTQYIATRNIYDAWLRAVYKQAHGTYSVLSQKWNTDQNERSHGMELIVVVALQAVIADTPMETAPVDTQGDITTSLEDVDEKTIEPTP